MSGQRSTKLGPAPEFTAIILAGPGGNLAPLSDPENMPKCLLPVVNRAMISYPLSWVEKAGITHCLVLCLEEHETAIAAWMKQTWAKLSTAGLKPTLVATSSDDELVGSADAIRLLMKNHTKHKIRSDVVILACDTVCDAAPYALLDQHRLAEASFTALYHRQHGEDIMTPQKRASKTFTGYEAETNTLLLSQSEADLEGDELEVRMSMLWKYPKVELTTTLQDCHLYVCKKWILDLIVNLPVLSRLNTELLPLLCKAQFQSLTRRKYDIRDDVRCSIHIMEQDPPVPFCGRVNMTQSYIDINKHALRVTTQPRLGANVVLGDRSTVGPDSLVGADTLIDDKVTIKRTILGAHCKIGKMARLTGCLIMDNVIIGDSVKLENCTVGQGAVIGDRSSLRDCIVGGKYTVSDKMEAKSEHFVVGGEISMTL
ncbi:nucleotide-diphospho-sugar transferase [Protomyces lactucae-debilis]|uniref:Translation initiation factor eIF2B subunit gamma n=1 Tax=Protomyces lactucae-debilis TaxID=2754530 RepID=A0A1Y2EU58_PROLT|nr:nucleotide-diphospho-sugar transferase [Protomyces lactucae-debilis]ORY75103.1 nucleotide-diphospho-sugar transferase [Protomyces lactucae-debilis]